MSDSCCAPTRGHIHSGTPKGSITTMVGIETYVTKTNNFTGKALILLTDYFGLPLVNSQLLADTFAEQGGLNVYMPDQFHGEPAPLSILTGDTSFKLMEWLPQHPKQPTYDNTVALINELKQNHGVTKIACIGYCWGGFTCFMLGATDLVDAVAVAHPSRFDFPGDIERLKKPTLFLCAETDTQLTTEKRIQSEEILKNRTEGHKFVVYPGTEHGFAVRADVEDKVAANAAEDAKNQALDFFAKHL